MLVVISKSYAIKRVTSRALPIGGSFGAVSRIANPISLMEVYLSEFLGEN